jgi:putative hemolysin
MDTQTLFNVGLVLLFVLVGGVFAATELALVSLRESQLTAMERDGGRGAKVARVARDPNRFLAAVQIGVTLAGFFSAAYGASTLADDVAPLLERAGLGQGAAEVSALVVLTLLIAYASLVLGELVPKRLALQRSVTIATAITPTLDRFATVMRPVIWVLSLSTNALVRLLGGDPSAASEQLSEDELREIVSTHESLDEQERRILADVFAAGETTLKEVVRPRGEVVFLPGDLRLGEAVELLLTQPYSRYPVTGAGFDDILGFLHVRDLLGVTPQDRRRVANHTRPVLMLPATSRVLPVVAKMRKDGVHIAVVVDEYGGTDGIVTLEDLVEEVVGEIRDEYDRDEPELSHHVDVLPGSTSLDDARRRAGLVLPDGSYETVAGLVISALGRIPEPGDRVVVDGTTLEVAEMAGPRVVEIRVIRA